MNTKTVSITLQTAMHPARAIGLWLKIAGCRINEPSFERIAQATPHLALLPGRKLCSLQDVQEALTAADFVVVTTRGTLHARKPCDVIEVTPRLPALAAFTQTLTAAAQLDPQRAAGIAVTSGLDVSPELPCNNHVPPDPLDERNQNRMDEEGCRACGAIDGCEHTWGWK